VLASALDAVITMDARGVITSWTRTPRRCSMAGAAAIGRQLADTIIPSRYRDAHRRGLAHFVATGDGPILRRRIEIIALHRGGHEFGVELTVTPAQQPMAGISAPWCAM